MGTRSLTIIEEHRTLDGEDTVEQFAVMYRHWDGYLSGHGADLAKFLDGMKLVNGLGGDGGKVANGTGCLAALLVAHFKGTEPGNVYLYPPGTEGLWEEFTYTIRCYMGDRGGEIRVAVQGYKENGEDDVDDEFSIEEFIALTKEG